MGCPSYMTAAHTVFSRCNGDQTTMMCTCEHSLDGLLGKALGKLELLDSHGSGPGDVAMDNRGAHIAGAVGLHPAMLCEDKALHPLPKVFDPGQHTV